MKLRLLLLHIAVYGPKLRAEVARLASSERASLVVAVIPTCHSSAATAASPLQSRLDRPAPLSIADPARHDRHLRESARLTHIDCETGKTWLPP